MNDTRVKPVTESRQLVITAAILLSAAWAVTWYFVPDRITTLSTYWHFFFIGVAGAIAANSTGAGGGIVFIPAFTSLGIGGQEALGTSIAIQCFGMTAGAVSWLHFINKTHKADKTNKLTREILLYASLSAVSGMLCGQYLFPTPSFPVGEIFRYFSILFGLALLLTVIRKHPHKHTLYTLRQSDIPLILATGFCGGAVTSWISVGAGEWLALLLFFLGYPTMVSVCIAVCVSSLTVLSGMPYHLVVTDSISWEILLFAAPAAIIGGSVARFLAQRLGPVRLKIFFAAWILATGFAMG